MISPKNPRDQCLSLLSSCDKEEKRKVLSDGVFWLNLLCEATSLEFKHELIKEMDLGEIGQLYYIMGVKSRNQNPLEIVLGRVRETYLTLIESDVLIDQESDAICDCFFILMSLYTAKRTTRKCDGICQNNVKLKSQCGKFYFCSTACGALYDAVGKHYGVSFFSLNR